MNSQYQIESDYQQIAGVCSDIRETYSKIMNEQQMNEVQISLSEALNNVIEHSYQESAGYLIQIACEAHDESFKIAITDFGCGMPEQNFTIHSSEIVLDENNLDSMPEGGMGIALIKSCMDHTKYCRNAGANVLKLTKLIRN